MTGQQEILTALLSAHALHLSEPPPPGDEPWVQQSLASGAAGTALFHIEAAAHNGGPWRTAHRWIATAARGEISAADASGLYLGAPAVGFLLSTVPTTYSAPYETARTSLHSHITALAHRRVSTALDRIRARKPAVFGEYDLLYGLTGIGAYLLRTDPASSAMEQVLTYLVALTRPLPQPGYGLPGWWVSHDPWRGSSPQFPGGHGNFGAAHGITGPLLLLAQSLRRNIHVPGQHEAIRTITDHLDTWRQDSTAGPWWPEHLARHDLEQGQPHHVRPRRPSWCYGTTGIARAGQLAGISTGNQRVQAFYEDALYQALTDPKQLGHVTDAALCHGWAGIYQTTARAAADARNPRLLELLPHLGRQLTEHAALQDGHDTGLLNGSAGTALTLSTLAIGAPSTGWDACLLIN